MWILIYVDDIILTRSSSTLINQVITDLQNTFVMTDLDPSHYFLGNEVEQTQGTIHLSQQKLATDLPARLHTDGAKLLSTLIVQGSKLSKHSNTPSSDTPLYQTAVGALQYLTLTRPNI